MSNNKFENYEQFYLEQNKVKKSSYSKHCKSFTRKLRDIMPEDKNAAILDVGCGCGFLVYFLKKQGYENVTGVDLNEQLISVAKNNVDGKFIAADGIDYVKEHKCKYDIIFMLNVLEHIPKNKILNSLKVLNESLNQDGFLFIRTPNMNNILAQGHFNDDFTHVTPVTEQSLEQISSMAGFSQCCLLHQFRMNNIKGKIKAVINWLIHKTFFWLRGGSRPKVFYRNIYALLRK